MLYKKFESFEDIYKNLNKDIILNADNYVIGTSGNSALLPFTVLECKTTDIGDSVKRSYKNISKFNVLVRKYLDLDKFKDFIEKMKNSSATSLTFYFNTDKKPEVHRYQNGGCILNFVVRRLKRNIPWEEITINYRTTQLNRAFAFDLIFFNKLINCLSNINFNKIRMTVVSPYFDMLEATHQFDLFDLNLETLPENNLVEKEILKTIDRVMTGETDSYVYHKYRRIAKEILNPSKNNCIDINKLKIFKEET